MVYQSLNPSFAEAIKRRVGTQLSISETTRSLRLPVLY
jgi:hypothetical protein